MRLTELKPRWFATYGTERHGMGIVFQCPHCRTVELPIHFTNPLDGGPPDPDAPVTWQRTGDTFDTLTLSPSIDASKFGCWHGHITNGEVT